MSFSTKLTNLKQTSITSFAAFQPFRTPRVRHKAWAPLMSNAPSSSSTQSTLMTFSPQAASQNSLLPASPALIAPSHLQVTIEGVRATPPVSLERSLHYDNPMPIDFCCNFRCHNPSGYSTAPLSPPSDMCLNCSSRSNVGSTGASQQCSTLPELQTRIPDSENSPVSSDSSFHGDASFM